MYTEYGNYRHRVNSTGITISQAVEETDYGLPYRLATDVNIEGRLINRTGRSTDFDSEIRRMEAAYSQPGKDFGLLHNNGTRTAAYWRNSQTIGGIRPKLLAYPNYKGGEYITYRQFQISLQILTRFGATPNYIRFSETLSISGGAETYGVKEVNYGPGVRQRLRTHTKCTATQRGTAVGRSVFPRIPPPVWPFALKSSEPSIDKVIRPRGSSRMGNVVLEECEISWTYEYEWPFRLDGIPHFAMG